jgi:hypothetical protein
MLPALVVLWLAAPEAQPRHRAAIAAWATSQGFEAADPAPTGAPAYPEQAAEEAERLLEEARETGPSARESFERLDAVLAAHPELPQAGWLLAERYALEAQTLPREPGATARPELARRRQAIEGRRASIFGATAQGGAPEASLAPLALTPPRPGDEVWLDGVPIQNGERVASGKHLAQVFRGDTRILAQWVDLESPPRLSFADTTPACAQADLSGTRAGAVAPRAAPGVSCASWAVATLDASGALLVSLCRGSSCEAWQSRAESGGTRADPDRASTGERSWPAWVTWSAVGVGVAAGAALVLWRTGALDHETRATQFVFTGPAAAATLHF